MVETKNRWINKRTIRRTIKTTKTEKGQDTDEIDSRDMNKRNNEIEIRNN